MFGTFKTPGAFGTLGTCLATKCSEQLAQIQKINRKLVKLAQHIKSQDVPHWAYWFCVSLRVVSTNGASGYEAMVSMLRLKIGSGMLTLSSCRLRLTASPYWAKEAGKQLVSLVARACLDQA